MTTTPNPSPKGFDFFDDLLAADSEQSADSVAEPRKRCNSCKAPKFLSLFTDDKRSRDGKRRECNECRNSDSRRNYTLRGGKVAMRRQHLKQTYGITADDYDAMKIAQDGLCAICRQIEDARSVGGGLKELAVDHDHDTGQVRGLLCSKCNQGLGGFRDNLTLLQSAIRYMERAKLSSKWA